MDSPAHTHCPDGTAQGHSRKRLQMVTDAAEGLGDSSHVSLSMYLCIYVFMQGHGSYPGLGLTQTRSTQQLLNPSDSKTVTWPAGWTRPQPVACGGSWEVGRGDTGRRQRWSEGTDRRTVRNKVARMSHPCHLALVCNFMVRCSFKCAVSLNVTPQSNLSLHEMKTEWKQLWNELSGSDCVCMHLTKRQNKRTWQTKNQRSAETLIVYTL